MASPSVVNVKAGETVLVSVSHVSPAAPPRAIDYVTSGDQGVATVTIDPMAPGQVSVSGVKAGSTKLVVQSGPVYQEFPIVVSVGDPGMPGCTATCPMRCDLGSASVTANPAVPPPMPHTGERSVLFRCRDSSGRVLHTHTSRWRFGSSGRLPVDRI